MKGFAAVALEPGERKTVKMELDESALSFFSLERRAWVAEPGDFEVLIAASATDIRLRGKFSYAKKS